MSITDDETTANSRYRLRRATQGVILAAAGVAIVGGVIGYAAAIGRMTPFLWSAAIFVLLVFAACAAFAMRQAASLGAALDRQSGDSRIDALQRARAAYLFMSPGLSMMLAPRIVQETDLAMAGHVRIVGPIVLALTVAMLGYILLTLYGLSHGKAFKAAFDDELSRAHRARGIQTGFAVLIAGVIGAFVAGLIEPRWTVLALPVVIMVAVAAAGFHFALLERRADAGG